MTVSRRAGQSDRERATKRSGRKEGEGRTRTGSETKKDREQARETVKKREGCRSGQRDREENNSNVLQNRDLSLIHI